MREEKISRLRHEIDRIDEEILKQLNNRARLVKQIGRVKKSEKQEFYIPSRERFLIDRLKRKNKGLFPTHAIQSVFREIISACRSLEVTLKIAYLAPEGTFTHMAALEYFGRLCDFVPCKTIGAVFKTVEKGKVHFGVAAIENSTAGKIKTTIDHLAQSRVKIVAEVTLRISHHLLSRSGTLREISEVRSHPQGFLQCSQWLKRNLPKAKKTAVTSTAQAAQDAKKNSKIAAIASEEAARLNNLKIVAKGIENNPDNRTRFLVLGRG